MYYSGQLYRSNALYRQRNEETMNATFCPMTCLVTYSVPWLRARFFIESELVDSDLNGLDQCRHHFHFTLHASPAFVVDVRTRHPLDTSARRRWPPLSRSRGPCVEHSAGWSHLLAVAPKIQETANYSTVCTELPRQFRTRLTFCLLSLMLLARPFRFYCATQICIARTCYGNVSVRRSVCPSQPVMCLND